MLGRPSSAPERSSRSTLTVGLRLRIIHTLSTACNKTMDISYFQITERARKTRGGQTTSGLTLAPWLLTEKVSHSLLLKNRVHVKNLRFESWMSTETTREQKALRYIRNGASYSPYSVAAQCSCVSSRSSLDNDTWTQQYLTVMCECTTSRWQGLIPTPPRVCTNLDDRLPPARRGGATHTPLRHNFMGFIPPPPPHWHPAPPFHFTLPFRVMYDIIRSGQECLLPIQ